jgi:hypothetical protein
MRTARKFRCHEDGCTKSFNGQHGLNVHFARMHGPSAVNGNGHHARLTIPPQLPDETRIDLPAREAATENESRTKVTLRFLAETCERAHAAGLSREERRLIGETFATV